MIRFATSSIPMVTENYLGTGLKYKPMSVKHLALRAMIVINMVKLLS